MLEQLILMNCPVLNKMHTNQFGFKASTSCNHDIFFTKQTVLHYTENNNSCKIASLDAEKAFDKVWRSGLFHKLINKIDPMFWQVLYNNYNKSKGLILNENYNIHSRVKQGGILSPFLFNLFINDLIKKCIEAKIGALLGNINSSIVVQGVFFFSNDFNVKFAFVF